MDLLYEKLNNTGYKNTSLFKTAIIKNIVIEIIKQLMAASRLSPLNSFLSAIVIAFIS